ncbi:hypothetical protein GPECTOR_153g62 [Gonium pectorale]|uniref:Reverse transcriptase domain-containing protein n=1 Tax=Gonium pectorale TaxID=33097 RepID=A0A150FXQ7_GONPE|nr:hypothetical protein GPECTOR_153g62 [Gonium pectorale]|eukprot:KXZ42389.1 hypothetical protein GPECTOR_153g62 [Gonium pectorale]
MTIDTGDASPIAQQPYRLSRVEKAAVDAEMAKMLADGIIEPSSSPWVSPVVVVPKKDGSLRPCVDMRRVNVVTKAVRHPLGHIQDIIDSVGPTGGASRYYSTLDLKSGYWQVPMADEASKERTAFATPSAQYQYTRMAMGLKGAAAVFAALMRRVLGPLLEDPLATHAGDPPPTRQRCAVVYLDDILVFSSSIEDHVRHLQQVFDLLRMANLRSSVSKCDFGQRKVVFLGHLLDGEAGTISPSPRNLAIIGELPSPRNVREFVLVTDSMAVRYLRTADVRGLHNKLARYALKLQGYDFDIIHKAGRKNANVDGLSRLAHLLPDPDPMVPPVPDGGPQPTLEEVAGLFHVETQVVPRDIYLWRSRAREQDVGIFLLDAT